MKRDTRIILGNDAYVLESHKASVCSTLYQSIPTHVFNYSGVEVLPSIFSHEYGRLAQERPVYCLDARPPHEFTSSKRLEQIADRSSATLANMVVRLTIAIPTLTTLGQRIDDAASRIARCCAETERHNRRCVRGPG